MNATVSPVATLHDGIASERDAFILAILNSVSAEIAVLDRDGVIVEVNQPWRRFAMENAADCGPAPSCTAVGVNYLAVCQASTGPDAAGALQAGAGIQAVLAGRLPCFELEYPCHSPGQQRWFSMSVTPLGSSLQGAVVAHADITEHKLAELELRSVLGALDQHAIVATTDLQGRITSTNDKFCAISGYARAELLTQNHRLLNSGLHPMAFFQDLYGAIARGAVWHGAICNRTKDGRLYWVQTTISPFLGADGRPEKYVSISTDITDFKQSEESLRLHTMQLKALSRRVLEVQEAERRHVAIELHDELGQLLTAIKINLQSSERFKDRVPGEHHAENIRIVEDALQQVRRLALALRPSMLDDLGLAPALRWMAEQSATRNGFTTQFHIARLPDRLAPDIEVACFRIVQEALTNIARYAQARQVVINLRQEGQTMVLSVQDDGRGFDVAAMRAGALAGGSMGVLGMQERAALIGGQFDIQSTPGHGSTVRVHFPLRLRGDSA